MKKFVINKRYIFVLLVIFIGLSLVIILSLDKNIDYSELDDFEFILEFGTHGDSIINTYENTLTNAFYNPDNYIDFKISKRVKKQIYKLMIQLDIMECENHLNYGVYDFMHPLSYTFQVSTGDETKTIYWSIPWVLSADDISKISDEQSRFLSFANYIVNYIRGTKAYKNLPEPTRFYL